MFSDFICKAPAAWLGIQRGALEPVSGKKHVRGSLFPCVLHVVQAQTSYHQLSTAKLRRVCFLIRWRLISTRRLDHRCHERAAFVRNTFPGALYHVSPFLTIPLPFAKVPERFFFKAASSGMARMLLRNGQDEVEMLRRGRHLHQRQTPTSAAGILPHYKRMPPLEDRSQKKD